MTNSWATYTPPTIDVPTGDGEERPVRGLSLEDLTALVTAHMDELMEIATIYVQSQKDVMAGTNMTDVVMVSIRQFPNIVSEVISMVTDTPSLRGVRLPVGLQIKVLQAAMRLTLEDVGGLGNLSAMLQDAVRAAVAGRGEVSQRLQDILSPSSTSGAGRTRTS